MKTNLKVIRHHLGETYTIGRLFIDDEYFCDTLEDKVRDYNRDGDLNDPGEKKVYGETAIPYGTYKVIVNESPKFKRLLPRLVDVPHFTGILIHRGNTAENTLGCILVGENKTKGCLTNSTPYEVELVERLKDIEEIEIEIV